ncbi:Calcium-transporting ATPase 8, plasma membrane-type [Morella rubra]|uniref:Calcium-transporting ATPase 8, plasma membrane-type n=1 Tax=Morella rubra TaxID=262757 RepID=A0A6A1W949_9ROSI|nr:Calcium-transporting ATPase 8, plasma membrane-type [Morella rubra]
MVKEKDFDSIHKFGGIQVVAKALIMALEKGIPINKKDPCSGDKASTLLTTKSPARGFLKFLCTNCTIILLLVAAVLSLGLGIMEDGLKTGWYEGIIIIVAIVILEIAPLLRKLWLKDSQKMSGELTTKSQQIEFDVSRGGCPLKLPVCDILLGDIVFLEREHLIPADGLFISGEFLKVNDGLDIIIDDKNPFLFYGAKVIDGRCGMLVTSVGMDTTWGHLMNKVAHDPSMSSLPAKLDKLRKEDVDSGHLHLKEKPTVSEELMDAIKRIVMKPNGKTYALTTALTMLLVGAMEGTSLVILLAIAYWNKKILSDKASAQEPLACLNMGSVTTICVDKPDWLIQNPLKADKRWTKRGIAVELWKNAGVNIILVSEDNELVLKAKPLECGLLPNSSGLVLGGEEFQSYTDEERMNIVDNIAVMGNSSPSDKLLLVQCLKKKGHKVAVVGVKTNEVPALKEADVGIVMETCSSEMARRSSQIIIRDGKFSLLFPLVRYGRSTYDNIQKYIQLELTTNIAVLLMTPFTTMFFQYSPIKEIEVLWVNFVVTLLGGLALLIEPPTEELMDKPPLRQSEPLITKVMWRNLVNQALYQATALLSFQFKGQAILGINERVSKTIILNSFVLCQVFSQVIAREPEKKNVFKGIHRNRLFAVGLAVILVLQVAFIELAHALGGYAKLNWFEWIFCLLIGLASWAIDLAMKYTSSCIMDWFSRPSALWVHVWEQLA